MTSTEGTPAQSSSGGVERQPNWARIANGQPWRLKRGRDFDYSIKRMRVEARMAAREMGKVVTFTKDGFDPSRFAWVQFADALVLAGSPCSLCGGDHLLQLSRQFARCTSCGAQLLVQHVPDLEDVELRIQEATHMAGESGETLDAYSRVHLSLAETDPTWERFIGYGFNEDGRLTLLYVVAPLAGGRRIPDPSPMGFLHTLHLAVVEPFGDITDDPGLLDTQSDVWDIVVQ